MTARKRWTEPELDIGPTDLALIAETWETPKDRVPPADTLSATLPLDEAYATHREDVAMRDAAHWTPGECE